MIRDLPCPTCGSMWFTFDPDSGCTRCAGQSAAAAGSTPRRRGRPRSADPLVTRQGKLYRMRSDGAHGPATLLALTRAQEGRCAVCAEAKPLEIDWDPDSERVLAGVCAGCRNMLGTVGRDVTLIAQRLAYFRARRQPARAARWTAILRYVVDSRRALAREAEGGRGGAVALVPDTQPPG